MTSVEPDPVVEDATAFSAWIIVAVAFLAVLAVTLLGLNVFFSAPTTASTATAVHSESRPEAR